MASVGRRFVAMVIDFLIVTLPIMVPAFLVLLPFGLVQAQERMLTLPAAWRSWPICS